MGIECCSAPFAQTPASLICPNVPLSALIFLMCTHGTKTKPWMQCTAVQYAPEFVAVQLPESTLNVWLRDKQQSGTWPEIAPWHLESSFFSFLSALEVKTMTSVIG